jgi:hypothetical protein
LFRKEHYTNFCHFRYAHPCIFCRGWCACYIKGGFKKPPVERVTTMPKLPFYLPMIEDDEESVFETWPNGQRMYDKLSEGYTRTFKKLLLKVKRPAKLRETVTAINA